MTKQIVLASGNMGKAREFGEILSPLGIEIHLQKEFDVPEVAEDGCWLSVLPHAAINTIAHASRIPKRYGLIFFINPFS